MTRINILLLAVLLTACGGEEILLTEDLTPEAAAADVRTSTGTDFELRIGEVAALREADLLVGFRGVRSDSRCPSDVTCVWAGDAELAVGVTSDRGSWTWYDVHTTLEPREITAAGYRIRLIELRPETNSGRRISPGDYRAVFQIVPA